MSCSDSSEFCTKCLKVANMAEILSKSSSIDKSMMNQALSRTPLPNTVNVKIGLLACELHAFWRHLESVTESQPHYVEHASMPE